MRRAKAALIYPRTKNPGAAQLLLGHSKFGSNVQCLVIEVDDAFEILEQSEASMTAFGHDRSSAEAMAVRNGLLNDGCQHLAMRTLVRGRHHYFDSRSGADRSSIGTGV